MKAGKKPEIRQQKLFFSIMGGIQVKRIISACLEQTIRFDTYNEADPKLDMKKYFEQLDRKRIRYRIVDQQEEADGAVVVRLKKQYNAYRTDGYIE